MSELLNLIGLSTGVVLYTMLLAMVVRRDQRSGAPTARIDPLLLATAILGLVWNICALPAYELPKLGVQGSFRWLTTIGFTALGLLPAVVVQSVLRGERDSLDGLRRLVAFSAYGVSGVAALLHVRALWLGLAVPAPIAMRLLTYAYIVLALPVAAVTRKQPGARRALWVAALSVFAVSALHLSQVHQGDASWPVELLGHHASVPLALAILYQDYPFALADLFLKRALTLLVLITTAFLAVTTLHPPSVTSPLGTVREVGTIVILWVATALMYPRLRDRVAWFVDSVVLHRPDYTRVIAEVMAQARNEQDIAAMLDAACDSLAPALSARSVTWRELPGRDATRPGKATEPTVRSIAVDIPVTETPQFELCVSGLTRGRRLLSDDRAALQSIAAILGRRIDAIRLARERYARQMREHEMSKLATEAELRALRSQINPHFLFNALTTIGYLIQTAPDRALDTLLRLTALLRGVLRSEGEFTTVGRELEIIEAYLEIERARFEQRLLTSIDVPTSLRNMAIPPLLLQPIVENAVKHGVAPRRDGGTVTLTAAIADTDPATLLLVVRDNGEGASDAELRRGRKSGVGLANVERRLAAHYGAAASLRVVTAPGAGTTVEIRIPAERRAAARVLPLSGGRSVS